MQLLKMLKVVLVQIRLQETNTKIIFKGMVETIRLMEAVTLIQLVTLVIFLTTFLLSLIKLSPLAITVH